MSTFDPTSRVNAIQAQAETAKGLVDKIAKEKVDAVFVAYGRPLDLDMLTSKTHELWEHARKQKNAINEKAIADINEIWAKWNEAEAKERKKRTK